MNKAIVLVLFLIATHHIAAQNHQSDDQEHEDGRGFRIIGIIGHTLVNNQGLDNVFVPSWGLDVEYWFNNKWGIGLHNDVEIETFVIRNSQNDEIERVNPLVFTIDALHQFGGGFVIFLGPGIELEKEESYYLMRVGMAYEKAISRTFYIGPGLSLDQRFDGYNT